MMKILTWNINGIRASKVPLPQLFETLDADIICIQETKITRDMLDEATAIVEGFNAYFSFCKTRSGYSGVATYVKNSCTPTKAEEGLTGVHEAEKAEHSIGFHGDYSLYTEDEIRSLDNEGRCIMTQHKMLSDDGEEIRLTVINVYCPMAVLDDPDSVERMAFKLKFYDLLQKRAEAILQSGSHVIILGDVNASHRPIDHCDPCDEKEFNQHPSRKWLNNLLRTPTNSNGLFVDSFRHFHPDQREAYTCWQTLTGARATNYGTRIDYIIGDTRLVEDSFSDCVILPDVQGSDHCPVKAVLHWECIPAKKYPPLCSKYLPEFVGKQQKLSSYFSKGSGAKSGSDTSSQESNDSTKSYTASKRSGDSTVEVKPTKKLKSVGFKQGSIQSFFKQNRTQVTSNSAVTLLQTVAAESGKRQSDCVTTWKSIFKGPKAPPTAPLCSGHKEACLLRTVKKDSLNKGRDFWVCNRPEGHKSNKEARCEHFEWVSKK